MDKVVLTPQNLPEQLRLSVHSPLAPGHPCISDLMARAYETDPQPGNMLEAIQTKSGLQENTIAEFIEEG